MQVSGYKMVFRNVDFLKREGKKKKGKCACVGVFVCVIV